jgi:hypothetical protein
MGVAVGKDLDAARQQGVVQAADRAFVAGMTRDEKIAVSPVSSTRSRCSPLASLAIEARGSPWLPVQM